MEEEMDISEALMTRLSRMLLERIPAQPISEARRRNWAALYAELEDICLWREPLPVWTPSGFPIVVDDAARVVKAPAEQGVYCPRHWSPIPAPAEREFDDDHRLSQHLVTLPCDQRYAEDSMRIIARSVRAVPRIL